MRAETEEKLHRRLFESLGRFAERAKGRAMEDTANQLIDLLDTDAVEPVRMPGGFANAEDLADRLEARVQKVLRRADEPPEGIEVVEEAVAYLRAHDGTAVASFAFEDGDGVRWFVLTDQKHRVLACYTSAPFMVDET